MKGLMTPASTKACLSALLCAGLGATQVFAAENPLANAILKPLEPVLAKAAPQAQAEKPAPTMTLQILNNTQKPIWIIIQTSMTSIDEWLQGYFQVETAKLNILRYGHTQLYRIYVNGTDGIPALGSVNITIPFFSRLTDNANGLLPNQYIDWWNGARIYVYDNKDDLIKAYNGDANNPVNPKTTGPSCKDNTCTPFTIYSGTAGLTERARSQLAEYTFSAVIKGKDKYSIDYSNVDYDISYVDHAYLPIAIEPRANPYIGYTGTVMLRPTFASILTKFTAVGAVGEGWPMFIIPNNPDKDLKLPGAYNVFALPVGQDITEPGKSVQAMRNLWTPCLQDINKCTPDFRQVREFFDRNYQTYQTRYVWCMPRVTNTVNEMLKHIYGWVPFNEGCNNPAANALKDTQGYLATHATYRKLQYDPTGRFNPYVKLIHDKGFLDMSAYAFSIDDAVGNMQELGNGLIVAIGGNRGLPNKGRFDPSKALIVSMGKPPVTGPAWKKYGACTLDKLPCSPNMNIPTGILGFKLGTIDYPSEVVITDANNTVYRFQLAKAPPITQADVSNCSVNNAPNSWCQGLVVSKQKDNLTGHDVYYVNTQPPAKPVTPQF